MAYRGKLTRNVSRAPTDSEEFFDVDRPSDTEAYAQAKKWLTSNRIMHKSAPMVGQDEPSGFVLYKDGKLINLDALREADQGSSDDEAKWNGYRLSVRASNGAAVHYLAVARDRDGARQAVWTRRGIEEDVSFVEDSNALTRARDLKIPNGMAFEDSL